MVNSKDTQAREVFVDVADVQAGSRVLDLGWEGDCLEYLRETGARVTFVGEDIRAVQRAEDTSGKRGVERDAGTGGF